MVIVLKPHTEQEYIDVMVAEFHEMGLGVGVTQGVGCTILGLIGIPAAWTWGASHSMTTWTG